MKKLISISILSVAVLFSLSAEAKTIQMEVVDVQPVIRNVAVNVPVNFQEEVCYRYKKNSRGVLEKIVDNGFGSQGGLIGAGVGVAIVDELDGNDAAKILGGLIGNRIGNDISQKHNGQRHCEMQNVTKYERHFEQRVTGYRVTVNHYGLQFTLNRNQEPQIGQMITVNVSAW
tara:strand:- start:2475 stop:2993 length:519 start_codon:yes stop_codon:yes gene_type:complete